MIDRGRKLAYILKQPFESSAEAMVRMHEAAFMIEHLIRLLEEKEQKDVDGQVQA